MIDEKKHSELAKIFKRHNMDLSVPTKKFYR